MNESRQPNDGFTKRQLLASSQFVGVERDIIAVVLEDKVRYTLEQAKTKMIEFGKGKVK